MGGDPGGGVDGGRGGGGTVTSPNIFDGPMLKPLNNYCWLCVFSPAPPPPPSPQPWREIAAAGESIGFHGWTEGISVFDLLQFPWEIMINK